MKELPIHNEALGHNFVKVHHENELCYLLDKVPGTIGGSMRLNEALGDSRRL